MKKQNQIDLLRNEHRIAVNEYDFDRAETISKQINRIQADISRNSNGFSIDLDEKREVFLNQTIKQKNDQTQKRFEIQKKYHEKYQQLLEKQTEEITQLSLKHALDIEREISRPIYEVEQKLAQSRSYGKNHDYKMAKMLYKDAVDIKESITEKRKAVCEEQYRKQKEKIEKRHQKEISLLTEKQQSEIEAIERQAFNESIKIQNAKNATILKATLKPKEKPVISNVMTPRRRSASVTRSISESDRYSLASSKLSFNKYI